MLVEQSRIRRVLVLHQIMTWPPDVEECCLGRQAAEAAEEAAVEASQAAALAQRKVQMAQLQDLKARILAER